MKIYVMNSYGLQLTFGEFALIWKGKGEMF